jgi:hypothetical protein
VNEQTKRDDMAAVKRQEARNPIGEKMDNKIARKQQEMRRDAIALEKEEMEKRDPVIQHAKNATANKQLKDCKHTDAPCKLCQEPWNKYVSTLQEAILALTIRG